MVNLWGLGLPSNADPYSVFPPDVESSQIKHLFAEHTPWPVIPPGI